jgi:transcriptional regulator with XRE-family HTH domain
MSIFERLKEERSKMGLNQDDFAEIGGVKRRAQSTYETGERLPDAGYLSKIAEAGVDVAYILTGVRSGAAKLEAQGEAADGAVDLERLEMVMRVLDEALTKYRRVLDPDKKAKVIALLYQLAGQPGYASATAEKMLELVD